MHCHTSRSWIHQLPSGRNRQFAAGEVICHPGQSDNAIFLITRGRARICLSAEHKELTLGWLNPGSLYVTHTRAWVEALDDTHLTLWPLGQLVEMIQVAPEMAIAALREVGLMMDQATSLIEDLAFRSVESRLARYILLEAAKQPDNAIIPLDAPTELLASLLGTSRQTLSTLLNRMIRTGVLARPARNQLRVLDHSKLEKLALVSAS